MNPWRQLLDLDRGLRRWTLAATLLAVLAAFAAVGLVAVSGWLITASALAGLAAAAGGLVTLEIFAPGALVRGFAILRTVGRYGERLLMHEAIFRVMARLRRDIFARLSRQPLQSLSHSRRSGWLSRMMHDVEILEGVHAGLLLPSLAALVISFGAAFAAALLFPVATLAFLLLASGNLLCCILLARSGAQNQFRLEARRHRSRRDLPELLDAHRELWFADPRQQRLHLWLENEAKLLQAEKRKRLGVARAEAVIQIILGLALVMLIWLSAPLLASGEAPAPLLAVALLSMLALTGLWSGLPRAWKSVPAIHSALRRTLDSQPASAAPLQSTNHNSPAGWSLQSVCLHRGLSGAPLIDGLSMQIRPGTTMLISGRSGSGKSSLAQLLTGQLAADAGQILLDGSDLSLWPERQRFSRIALLPQKSTLLSATLADNLRLANPALSDHQLRTALRDTGLDYLADDLNQWVGLNGRPLSGGEARRIALIRCLLAQSGALILDEPFRGLDEKNRQRVLAWTLQERRGRTLILLDHHAPTNFKADLHLPLQAGEKT